MPMSALVQATRDLDRGRTTAQAVDGQVAIVSGGGSGLGRASALELAALGSVDQSELTARFADCAVPTV